MLQHQKPSSRDSQTVTRFGFPRDFPSGLRQRVEPLLSRPIDFMEDTLLSDEASMGKLRREAETIARPRMDWYVPLMRINELDQRIRVDRNALLTARQERVLFLCFNDARRRAELARASIRPRRVAISKARAMVKALDEARHYRELIAECNVALVLAMIRRYNQSRVDFAELISEGNVALLNAIDKFRVSRGFKFSSYACRCILAALGNAAAGDVRRARLFPAGYDPAMERSNFDQERAADLETDCADEVGRILQTNAADLNDLEQEIIRLRFYETNDKDRPITLEQVGRMIGFTKERVRQIQLKAMAKIRETLEEQFLDGRPPAAGLN